MSGHAAPRAQPAVRRAPVMAAVLLLAAVAGCGSAATPTLGNGTEGPGGPPSTLIGMWTVQPQERDSTGAGQATDNGSQTVLRLSDTLDLFLDCGIVSGSWTASPSGALLTNVYAGDMTCGEARVRTPPAWLTQAVAYRLRDGRPQLLDHHGDVTADLRPGAHPTAPANHIATIADPPETSPQWKSRLDEPVELPTGLTPAATADLVGTWLPADEDADHLPDQMPYLRLAADGTWQSFDGCNSPSGDWHADPDGRLLVLGLPVAGVGCENEFDPGQYLLDGRAAAFPVVDGKGPDLGLLTFLDEHGGTVRHLRRQVSEPSSSPLPPTDRTEPPSQSSAPATDVPASAVAQLEAAVDELTAPPAGIPAASEATLRGFRVHSWRSPDDFTLLVTLVVRFPAGTATSWNDGVNERFVTFTRDSASKPYHLAWATSP